MVAHNEEFFAESTESILEGLIHSTIHHSCAMWVCEWVWKVGCKMCTELGPMLTMFSRNPVSMIAVICEMFPNGCCWRLEEWSAGWCWAVNEPSRSCTVPREALLGPFPSWKSWLALERLRFFANQRAHRLWSLKTNTPISHLLYSV